MQYTLLKLHFLSQSNTSPSHKGCIAQMLRYLIRSGKNLHCKEYSTRTQICQSQSDKFQHRNFRKRTRQIFQIRFDICLHRIKCTPLMLCLQSLIGKSQNRTDHIELN